MRRPAIALLLLTLLLTAALAADRPGSPTRDLTGAVLTRGSDQPVENAIVHLRNPKTLDVKTYITSADGRFRFPALPMNADFEVFAQHDGHRSETKTLSSFDSRHQAHFTLHIDQSK